MSETVYRAFPENFSLAVRNCERAIETRIIIGRVSFGLKPPDTEETPHLNSQQRASAIAYGESQYEGEGFWARMMMGHPNLQEEQLKFERVIDWSDGRRELIITPLPRGL